VDALIQAGLEYRLGLEYRPNTGRGSDVIVLIEAGGFYSRKHGNTLGKK